MEKKEVQSDEDFVAALEYHFNSIINAMRTCNGDKKKMEEILSTAFSGVQEVGIGSDPSGKRGTMKSVATATIVDLQNVGPDGIDQYQRIVGDARNSIYNLFVRTAPYFCCKQWSVRYLLNPSRLVSGSQDQNDLGPRGPVL